MMQVYILCWSVILSLLCCVSFSSNSLVLISFLIIICWKIGLELENHYIHTAYMEHWRFTHFHVSFSLYCLSYKRIDTIFAEEMFC